MSTTRAIVLTLFTIVLGVTLGAGLYELRIEVPEWIEQTATGYRWNADAARDADVGRRFWAFVTTGPLTLLTLASLVLSWGTTGALRRWWLTAAIVSAVDRVATFAYFIPTMLVLMTDTSLAPSEAADTARLWATLGWGREALTLIAFLGALRALTLVGHHPQGNRALTGSGSGPPGSIRTTASSNPASV